MHQASTILRNTRLDKDLTLDEVAKKTKIPKKYIIALEEAACKNYPQEPYCSLYVRDYAQFLGLNSSEILSIFRRDYYQTNKKKQSNTLPLIGITPQLTFTIGIFATIFIFSLYLLNEYVKFNRPPSLHVNWPSADLVLGASIELSGDTNPESTVRINQDLVVVDESGKFTKKINLINSETKVIIESKSPSGKSTIEEKIIKTN